MYESIGLLPSVRRSVRWLMRRNLGSEHYKTVLVEGVEMLLAIRGMAHNALRSQKPGQQLSRK